MTAMPQEKTLMQPNWSKSPILQAAVCSLFMSLIDIPISASRQKVHLTIRLLNSLLWVAMDGLEVHVYISFAISMRMVKNKEK